jgi:hypothetical protein
MTRDARFCNDALARCPACRGCAAFMFADAHANAGGEFSDSTYSPYPSPPKLPPGSPAPGPPSRNRRSAPVPFPFFRPDAPHPDSRAGITHFGLHPRASRSRSHLPVACPGLGSGSALMARAFALPCSLRVSCSPPLAPPGPGSSVHSPPEGLRPRRRSASESRAGDRGSCAHTCQSNRLS